MNLEKFFRQQLEQDLWANECWIQFLEGKPVGFESKVLLAKYVSESRRWACSILDEKFEECYISDIKTYVQRSYRLWVQVLDQCDLGQTFSVKQEEGHTKSLGLSDIIWNSLAYGTFGRGRVKSFVEQEGIDKAEMPVTSPFAYLEKIEECVP